MSEAEQTAGAIPQRLFDTRQPFDLTDEMQARVEELGLETHACDGRTVIGSPLDSDAAKVR